MKADYYKRSNLKNGNPRNSYVQLQQESKRETFMKGGDKKKGKGRKEYDENTTINTLQPQKKSKKKDGKSQAKQSKANETNRTLGEGNKRMAGKLKTTTEGYTATDNKRRKANKKFTEGTQKRKTDYSNTPKKKHNGNAKEKGGKFRSHK